MALVTTYHNSLLRAMSSDVAPYFRAYLLTLRPVETDKIPTAAVDKYARVYWNREFFASMHINEGAFVVLHEMMHLFLHHERRAKVHGVTDFKLWNIATDCEINRTLAQMLGITVPASACLPEKFKDQGIILPPNGTAEMYYDLLRQNQPEEDGDGEDGDTDGPEGGEPGTKSKAKKPGTRGGPDVHGTGVGDTPGDWELPVDDTDSPGASEVDKKMAEEQSSRDIAETNSRTPGRVPGDISRHAESIMAPPKVPWTRVLKSAVNHGVNAVTGYDEPTYRRIAARSFSMGDSGVLLPTYESYQPRVAIGIDTSGSMSTKDLETALRESNGVCKSLDCTITVFAADTKIGAAQHVTSAREIKLSGGGGTDMAEVIVSIMALRPRFDIIIILTDGYTGWPASNPNPRVKVIAIITEGGISDLSDIPPWITAIKVN